MDIEISSIIIGAGFLAVFFVPIMYSQRKQKTKHRKLLASFEEAAKSHQFKITQLDVLGDQHVIGIDNLKKKVFFFRNTEGGTERILIDLRDVEACKLINASRNLKTHAGNTTVVDRLGVRIIYKQGRLPEKKLLFYDGTSGNALGNQFALAQKWVQVIQSNL